MRQELLDRLDALMAELLQAGPVCATDGSVVQHVPFEQRALWGALRAELTAELQPSPPSDLTQQARRHGEQMLRVYAEGKAGPGIQIAAELLMLCASELDRQRNELAAKQLAKELAEAALERAKALRARIVTTAHMDADVADDDLVEHIRFLAAYWSLPAGEVRETEW